MNKNMQTVVEQQQCAPTLGTPQVSMDLEPDFFFHMNKNMQTVVEQQQCAPTLGTPQVSMDLEPGLAANKAENRMLCHE
jgi:hypothetical protein